MPDGQKQYRPQTPISYHNRKIAKNTGPLLGAHPRHHHSRGGQAPPSPQGACFGQYV